MRRTPLAQTPVGWARESGMYTRLTEHLCVTSSTVQATRAVCMGYADAVQLDVVVFVMPEGANLTVDLQGSNDGENWISVGTFNAFVPGYSAMGPTTNIAWRYVRVVVSSDNAGTSIVAIGLNAAQLGAYFRGRTRGARTYARLAEHLCVTSATEEATRAVSMVGADAVQLDVVVFTIPAFATVTLEIQGSNDCKDWATVLISSATEVGYVGTIQATNVDWKYVRLAVRSDNASASIVAIGLRTAKLGSPLRETTETGTYTRLAEHVSVANGHDEATYPVWMGEASRANVDFEVLASPGSPFDLAIFILEASNDLQNWALPAFPWVPARTENSNGATQDGQKDHSRPFPLAASL